MLKPLHTTNSAFLEDKVYFSGMLSHRTEGQVHTTTWSVKSSSRSTLPAETSYYFETEIIKAKNKEKNPEHLLFQRLIL